VMLSSAPGFSSTVWTWAGNDVLRKLYPMLAGPEEDRSQRRSDPLPGAVDENLGPGQGNDIERGLARKRRPGPSLPARLPAPWARLRPGSLSPPGWRRRPFGAATASFTLRELLGIFCSWRDLRLLGPRRGFPCFTLGGLHAGRFPGVATRYTVFGPPSVFRWLRAITPVPTISVNASGAATNNLLLTHPSPRQASQAQLRELGQAQARETQGLLRCRQRDRAPQIARRGADRVDLVLAHVFVGLGSLVVEQLAVVLGQARIHVVIGARRRRICPGSAKLMTRCANVDSVADDVGLAV